MFRTLIWGVLSTVLLVTAADAGKRSAAPALTADAINSAEWSEGAEHAPGHSPLIFRAKVLLARLGFSPGVIDGRGGQSFEGALRAYQQVEGLEPTGTIDQPTWEALAATSSDDVVRTYAIATSDVKGPFVRWLPKDYEEMAALDQVPYRSPRELLAEKFNMSQAALRALNPRKDFKRAGTEILVAAVEPLQTVPRRRRARRTETDANVGASDRRSRANPEKAARVEVHKGERAVRVFARDGRLLAYYPASIGSDERPAPSGTYEIRKVAFKPTFRYDPKYAFKGQKATEPVHVAPGPNNPVGLVWIALSTKSYGIHGTPDPERVGKTASHGCVRLTNWDVVALSRLVSKGTPVHFIER